MYPTDNGQGSRQRLLFSFRAALTSPFRIIYVAAFSPTGGSLHTLENSYFSCSSVLNILVPL